MHVWKKKYNKILKRVRVLKKYFFLLVGIVVNAWMHLIYIWREKINDEIRVNWSGFYVQFSMDWLSVNDSLTGFKLIFCSTLFWDFLLSLKPKSMLGKW